MQDTPKNRTMLTVEGKRERVSTLMYRGAGLVPGLSNTLFEFNQFGPDGLLKVTAACAEGCVLMLVDGAEHPGGMPPEFYTDEAYEHPKYPGEWSTMHRIVTSLNDRYNWRRRRIAAWCRTQGW